MVDFFGNLEEEDAEPEGESEEEGGSDQLSLTNDPSEFEWISKADYNLVDTEEKLADLDKDMMLSNDVSIDTETTGKMPWKDTIVGISASHKEGQGFYIPIGHAVGKNLPKQLVSEACRRWVAPGPKDIAMAHASFDKSMFINTFGYNPRCTNDVLIMCHFINSRGHHGLKDVVWDYLKLRMYKYEDIVGRGKSQVTMDCLPPETVYRYACTDSDLTLRLKNFLWKDFVKLPAFEFLYIVEMGIIDAIREMECTGIKVSIEDFERIEQELIAKIAESKKDVFTKLQLEEDAIELNSNKQLGHQVFDVLKIPCIMKTKAGAPSLNGKVIEAMGKRYPAIEAIGKYRGYIKLLSGFVTGIAQKAQMVGNTPTMFYKIYQAHAQTGRMGSAQVDKKLKIGVNIQQIPKPDQDSLRIRGAYKARDGFTLVSADFSQIELRVLGSEANIASLREGYASGIDAHTQMATQITKKPVSEITEPDRDLAKTMNFMMVYGGSFKTLATKAGISDMEAKSIFKLGFDSMPEYAIFAQARRQEAERTGKIQTRLGRQIPILELQSPDFRMREKGYRKCVNVACQGGAADIFKVAIYRVWKLREQYGDDVHLLAPVHDELLMEVRDTVDMMSFLTKLRKAMEVELENYIPIVVNFKTGKDWSSMKKVKDNLTKDGVMSEAPALAKVGPKEDSNIAVLHVKTKSQLLDVVEALEVSTGKVEIFVYMGQGVEMASIPKKTTMEKLRQYNTPPGIRVEIQEKKNIGKVDFSDIFKNKPQ